MVQGVGVPILAFLTLVESKPLPPADLVLIGVGLGAVNAFAFYGLYASLAIGNMARVAPVFALSAAIPVIVGLGTGDRPSAWQLLGIVVALAGVALVSTEPRARRATHAHRRRRARRCCSRS